MSHDAVHDVGIRAWPVGIVNSDRRARLAAATARIDALRKGVP
ncbi:hypothetical protein [Phytohabitans suffuscus]|nr:hypothetical protein [Phytohabitans suffuscus]